MGALERFLLLQIIDERWREHLFDMDYLREGIHLRGFAQIDPLVAYKNEAFTLFGDLMNSVWSDYARMIFNVQVNVEGENGGAGAAPSRRSPPPATRRAPGACPTRAATAPPARARWPRRLPPPGSARAARRGRVRRERPGAGSAAGRRAARARRRAPGRAQRPVLVRVGQEVQEVPRRLALAARRCWPRRARLVARCCSRCVRLECGRSPSSGAVRRRLAAGRRRAPRPRASRTGARTALVCVGVRGDHGQRPTRIGWRSPEDAEDRAAKGQPAPNATELRNEVLGLPDLLGLGEARSRDLNISVSVSRGQAKSFDHITRQAVPQARGIRGVPASDRARPSPICCSVSN